MNYIDQHIDEIRNEFNLLNHWYFFNAADQNIPGNYWIKAARKYYDFQEHGRMEDIPNADIATHPFLIPMWDECIIRGAKLINADKNEVTNMYRPAITANLILYNMFDWHSGDNVIITDLSYPSIIYILLDLKKRYGVELRVVKNINGEILMLDVEKQLDKKTKMIIVDRTTAFCGFTFNMKELCKLAHSCGALVLDDAFQALGAINIDVKDDDVDIMISGAYKWQCGPEGAGLFYIKQKLIEAIDPKFRNYIWSDFPGPIPFSLQNHDNIKHWEYPLVNNANKFSQDATIGASLFGWNATLKFYEKIGIHNVEERIKRLGSYAIHELRKVNCKITSPIDPNKRHGLITFTLGSYEKDYAFFQRCASPGRCMKPIKISMRALGGVGNLRMSNHFYNTEEDIDYLVNLIKKIN